MKNKTLALPHRVYIISKIYFSINNYFAHWEAVPGLDIDSLYKKYLSRAIKMKDRFEFGLLMKEFIAHLKNGHSGYMDKWILKNYGHPLSFYASYLKDKWSIKRSLIKELAPGDIILNINGRAMEKFFQEKKKYISASSEREARIKFFYNSYLFPQKFTLYLQNGKKISIKRGTKNLTVQEKSTQGSWLKRQEFAYVKIPSFGEPKFEKKALELIKGFKNAKTLIIDVRENGGGSTPENLIKSLMNKPYRWWTESISLNISPLKYYSEKFKNKYISTIRKYYLFRLTEN